MKDYQVVKIDEDFELKQKFIEYAKTVTGSAGPFLAKLMEQEETIGYDQVFAIRYMNQYFCGFCRFSEKDCIETTLQPWIGFLFIEEKHRGKKLSKLLIEHCIEYAKTLNFKHVYLASQEHGLYEKYGFELLDCVIDIYGEQEQIFTKKIHK